MATLIDSARSLITPEIVQGASMATGEHESATRDTINAAIPTVLAGAVGLGSTTSGAERLLRMISDGGYGDQTINNLSATLGDKSARQSLEQSGSNILSTLFGDKTDSLNDAIAHATGVKKGSAATLMAFVAPLVMSVIGRHVSSRGLDAGGLMNLLQSEKHSINSALPPGVARIIAHEAHREHAGEMHRTHAEPHKKRNWGPALIGALAVIALLFLLGRRSERREVTRAPVAEQPAPPAAIPAPGAAVPAAPAGMEEIRTFIVGRTPGGKAFAIERVTFVAASPQLTPEGKAQLSALGRALRENPNAHAQIEGATENGTASENRKLSKDRADAIKSELTREGVPASQIETKGTEAKNHVATITIKK